MKRLGSVERGGGRDPGGGGTPSDREEHSVYRKEVPAPVSRVIVVGKNFDERARHAFSADSAKMNEKKKKKRGGRSSDLERLQRRMAKQLADSNEEIKWGWKLQQSEARRSRVTPSAPFGKSKLSVTCGLVPAGRQRLDDDAKGRELGLHIEARQIPTPTGERPRRNPARAMEGSVRRPASTEESFMSLCRLESGRQPAEPPPSPLSSLRDPGQHDGGSRAPSSFASSRATSWANFSRAPSAAENNREHPPLSVLHRVSQQLGQVVPNMDAEEGEAAFLSSPGGVSLPGAPSSESHPSPIARGAAWAGDRDDLNSRSLAVSRIVLDFAPSSSQRGGRLPDTSPASTHHHGPYKMVGGGSRAERPRPASTTAVGSPYGSFSPWNGFDSVHLEHDVSDLPSPSGHIKDLAPDGPHQQDPAHFGNTSTLCADSDADSVSSGSLDESHASSTFVPTRKPRPLYEPSPETLELQHKLRMQKQQQQQSQQPAWIPSGAARRETRSPYTKYPDSGASHSGDGVKGRSMPARPSSAMARMGGASSRAAKHLDDSGDELRRPSSAMARAAEAGIARYSMGRSSMRARASGSGGTEAAALGFAVFGDSLAKASRAAQSPPPRPRSAAAMVRVGPCGYKMRLQEPKAWRGLG